MTHRFVIVAAAGAALAASAASAQVFDIVVDQNLIDLENGNNQVVNFSLYLDIQGNTTDLDVGASELVSFNGWSSFRGTFSTTNGQFVANQESSSDARGGTIATPFGDAIYNQTGWFGRAPGTLAEGGSSGVLGPGSVAPGTPVTGSSDAGDDGSFRFGSGSSPSYITEANGTILSDNGGVIEGGQSSSAIGGEGQDTAGRVEVFRGQIVFSFVEGDISTYTALLGTTDIDFNGAASIFIDANLEGFAPGLSISNTGGLITVVPTPSAVALLGLGGLAAGRRRR
ncbi:MAG: hypothetical protein AAGB51_07570 [Planctomycetota bacterium]